jgi:hypothetical protein
MLVVGLAYEHNAQQFNEPFDAQPVGFSTVTSSSHACTCCFSLNRVILFISFSLHPEDIEPVSDQRTESKAGDYETAT